METGWNVLTNYLIELGHEVDSPLTFNAKYLLDCHYKVSFLEPLSYYQKIIKSTDLVLFPYMFPDNETDESRANLKRKQLKQDLEIARFLLAAQAGYEKQHQKNENLIAYLEQIDKCSFYIGALTSKYAALQAQLLETKITDTNYLGLSLGQELTDEIRGIVIRNKDSKTKAVGKIIEAVNGQRLYWIWGSSFLKTILAAFPDDFFNVQQAIEVICMPDPFTSCLSWLLYFSRFGMNLGLSLKHIVPWWLTDEEEKTSWTERLNTQWEHRKFSLLNDFLWGIANFLCVVWLTGRGTLGAVGDALTVVLLAFDLMVVLWDFSEQQANHTDEIKCFERDIQFLEQKINALEKIEGIKIGASNNAVIKMKLQLAHLQRAKSNAENNWRINKYGLYNNGAYAAGLMIAFIIFTIPFMPIPAATAAILTISGAILCFTFTVINNAINGGMNIYKTRFELKNNEARFDEHVSMMNGILRIQEVLDNNEKIYIFLELKKMHATIEYQRKLTVYQTMGLIRSIIIETVIPAIIFVSLVFLPLGIGLGALVAALSLAIATHFLIESIYNPDEKMKELPKFSTQEYTDFSLLKKEEVQSSKNYYSFFESKTTNVSEEKPELNMTLLNSN